jgi:hypothetical protein
MDFNQFWYEQQWHEYTSEVNLWPAASQSVRPGLEIILGLKIATLEDRRTGQDVCRINIQAGVSVLRPGCGYFLCQCYNAEQLKQLRRSNNV